MMNVEGNSKSCHLTELGATTSYSMMDCKINGIVFNFTDEDMKYTETE